MRLQKLYDELNDELFDGRLPRYKVRVSNSIPSHGTINTRTRTIVLGKGMEPEELRQFLLHEMCHIGCPSHGVRFQNKLSVLALKGETWAKEEIKMYRESLSWNDEMSRLRKNFDELASYTPRPSFTGVLRASARDLGMTMKEVTKKAPWLRRAWRKACQEADNLQQIREQVLAATKKIGTRDILPKRSG